MADEHQIEENPNEEVVDTTNQNPVEEEALKYGWKPLEEFDGEPSQWRSAETFLALKPFFERIEDQGKKLKRFEKSFHQVSKDMAALRKVEFNRAIQALKNERKNAFEEGDMDRYHLLEDQMDNIKEQARQAETAPAEVDDNSEVLQQSYIDWQVRNSWYNEDSGLKEWADGRGILLHNQGHSPDDILVQLEKEVKKKFPNYFTNPNRQKPSSVEGGNNKAAGRNKTSVSLSPQERRIMETIVRTGVITEAEYLKQYQEQNKG